MILALFPVLAEGHGGHIDALLPMEVLQTARLTYYLNQILISSRRRVYYNSSRSKVKHNGKTSAPPSRGTLALWLDTLDSMIEVIYAILKRLICVQKVVLGYYRIYKVIYPSLAGLEHQRYD